MATRRSALVLLRALLAACPQLAQCSSTCDLDLCSAPPAVNGTTVAPETATEPPESGAGRACSALGRPLALMVALLMSRSAGDCAAPVVFLAPLALMLPTAAASGQPGPGPPAGECHEVKSFYQDQGCCGNPDQALTGPVPAWACRNPSGVCACERMKTALAGVPGAMFPANFCDHFEHVKPVGHRSAPLPEASDACLDQHFDDFTCDPSLVRDGHAGNITWPHGLLKVLATVGEVNPVTGAMLTGVPDGNGVYLKDANTVRYIYQSESYGPLGVQETFPYFVNEPAHVGITGSHIHFIDFDRGMMADYFAAGAPANAEPMVKDSGEAVTKLYNLKRQEVGPRSADGSSTAAHDSNVNLAGEYILGRAPAKADWLMQSLCSAHLAVKFQWGANRGTEDNLFITNEEWITYNSDAQGIIGLPAHVLNLASGELWATSAFGLGGFEKIVEVNTGTPDFVAFVPSGYNGAFGRSGFAHVVAERNANYTRTDGSPYVWPQNIVPTRLYVGKKKTDKDGNADTTDFLARNGFEFGAIYGFATDCSPGTPGAEGRDEWHRSTASAGDTVTGAFYKLRWQNKPGEVRDFVTDYAWEFQDAPEGAPAGWCFWTAEGADASGAKTEHVSPDPRGGHRVLQGSTAGYFGVYAFPDLPGLFSGASVPQSIDDFPQSIPATYTCHQPVEDVRSQIELGGAGLYKDGQDATVNPEADTLGTLVDVDALDWHAAANDEDYLIIHEDSGNDLGERKFLAKVGVPMKYYYVAMSGGKLSTRQQAGVAAVEGVFKAPNGHEFSGSTDLSGFLARDASGDFRLAAGDETGAARTIAASIPINEKSFIVSLQAHSNWGGWTESFNPDRVGQVLMYRPALPAAQV